MQKSLTPHWEGVRLFYVTRKQVIKKIDDEHIDRRDSPVTKHLSYYNIDSKKEKRELQNERQH